jgi:hypothetical protein
MSWLGEDLADQTGRGLFNDVGLAIFDTTSLYFEGDGGETLGHNGHFKVGCD